MERVCGIDWLGMLHNHMFSISKQLQNIQNKYDEEVASAEQNFQVYIYYHTLVYYKLLCVIFCLFVCHYTLFIYAISSVFLSIQGCIQRG